MTAEDVQDFLPRIKSARDHQDYDNVIWFVTVRDQLFNELSPAEQLRHLKWAKTQLPDPWCVPNLWGSPVHVAAVEAAAKKQGDVN